MYPLFVQQINDQFVRNLIVCFFEVDAPSGLPDNISFNSFSLSNSLSISVPSCDVTLTSLFFLVQLAVIASSVPGIFCFFQRLIFLLCPYLQRFGVFPNWQ